MSALDNFKKISIHMEDELHKWVAALRTQGVKAAHPDDGWVDRERNTVGFTYPHFDDGAGVGDLVALGWPAWGGKPRTRIVRITGEVKGILLNRWTFEATCGKGDSA